MSHFQDVYMIFVWERVETIGKGLHKDKALEESTYGWSGFNLTNFGLIFTIKYDINLPTLLQLIQFVGFQLNLLPTTY